MKRPTPEIRDIVLKALDALAHVETDDDAEDRLEAQAIARAEAWIREESWI